MILAVTLANSIKLTIITVLLITDKGGNEQNLRDKYDAIQRGMRESA